MGFLLRFLHSQLFVTLTYPTASFAGQTVIVTGSNIGLGFEAARHFARLGAAKVILAVRSVEKGEKAREDILASTKCEGDVVEVWPLDLGSCESVRAFARRAQGLQRVDALVENAGVGGSDWKLLDGSESVLQVNVIGTLLLALMMLPKLKETAREFKTQPRLEIVSSELYYIAKFPERKKEDVYAALNDEKTFKKNDRYPVSKLMEILFVRELSKYVGKEEVVVDCVNPGLCHSELTRNEVGVLKVVATLLKVRGPNWCCFLTWTRDYVRSSPTFP